MSPYLRNRQQGRDQSGYALMMVLAVIAFTSVMVAALMSLLFTTIKVNESATLSGRELRALDSATEAAINQMRFDPASTGRDACRLEPPVERVEEIRFDGGGVGDSDDLVVAVKCEGARLSDLESAADQVRLVSPSGYSGAIPWTNSSLWPSALDLPTLTSSAPNLVHRGESALQFGAGLTLRNTAAAVRTSGTGPAAEGPAVEVAGDYTQGSFGAGGDAGNPCGALAQSGPMQITALNRSADPVCGVPLDELVLDEDPTGAEAGFPIPTNLVPQVSLSCAESKVTEFVPGVYRGTQRMGWLNRLTNSATIAANCSGPSTFYFHPGVYYLDGTELVFDRPEAYFVAGVPKGWDLATGVQGSPLAGDPQAELCDPEQSGVTFVVPPQMKIEHKSGRLAMCAAFSEWEGQPPLPAIYQETSFPTRLQRSPWTQQFGVCAATPGLFTRAELDVVDTGGTSARPSGSRWADEQRLPSVPSDECRVGRSHRVDVTKLGPEPLRSAHLYVQGKESFPATLITDRRVMVSVRSGSAPHNRICTSEAIPGVSSGDWSVRVDLMSGSCGSARAGLTHDPRTSVQLIGQPLYSVEQTLNRTLLSNARLEVTQYITFKMSLFGVPMLITQNYTIEDVQLVVNGADTDVIGPVATPGPSADPVAEQGWHDAPAMLESAGVARPRMPNNRFMTGINSWGTSSDECPYLLCPVATSTRLPNRQTFQHVVEIDDLEIVTPQEYVDLGIDPRISSLKVRMEVDPTFCGDGVDPCEMLAPLFAENGLDLNALFQQSYTGTPLTARLELVTSSGRVCTTFKGKVSGAQEIVFDMLGPGRVGGGDCGRQLRTFSDLRKTAGPAADGRNRVNARVVFETECFRMTSSCHRGRDGALHLVWQIRPPSIKEVSLDIASDTYAGATTTSTMTIDADVGSSSASVNISGRVLLPRSNLDIIWGGDVTEGRPLVSDELVVGALGSRITAPPVRVTDQPKDQYFICCDPRRAESREVRLTATIGNRRLQADVLFTDVIKDENGDVTEYSPGHRVDVTDWQTCDSGRCSAGP